MPIFKKNSQGKSNQNISPTPFPKNSLLPTEEIISIAKKAGVNFGPGKASERIRYFIKLELLPHAVRKLRNYPSTDLPTTNYQLPTTPIGHLPYWTVERLVEINNLNNNGLTFPQIAKKLKSSSDTTHLPNLPRRQAGYQPIQLSNPITSALDPSPYPLNPNSQLIVKVVPLTDVNSHEMDKKFKDQQKKLESLIDNKFKSQGQIPVFHNLESTNTTLASKIARNSILIVIIFSLASGTVFIGLKSYQRFSSANSKATKQIAQDFQASGQVLAASSATNKLYIDADSEFSGTTLFKENITAPNVVYSVRAGTGIAVSAGQNPTVSLNTAAIVPSINSASGPITLKGSGSTSITNTGGTITISSSSATSGITSEADTLATVTGRGATTSTASSFTGGATVGTSLNLSYSTAAGGVGYLDGSSNLKISAAGTASQCLLSGGAGAPTWGACSGGSSGVTQLDSLTGNLTINNSSGSGTAITIDDATTAAKGIASFSSSYFSTSSGAVSIKTGGVTTTEILDGTILGGDLGTGINISTTGTIATTGAGTITSGSTLTASNGLTLTTGALNLTATSGALTLSGLSASSISTGANSLTFTSSNFNTTATGINGTAIGATTASTGAFTSLSSTIGTTLASTSGNVAIGNATGTFALTSTGLNVTTAGALSGITSLDTITASATALTFAAGGTIGATSTGLNLQADGTVDVNIAGGFGTTGCTVTNTTGALACAGAITGSNLSGTSSGSNTGDQTITLTGDVTGSGTGTFTTTVAKINGATLGTTTATDTNILIANGTSWVSQPVSGDITIGNTGVTAIGSGKVTSTMILNGTILNEDINTSAAIAYSKLALTGSIVGGDLASNITISTTGNISTTGSGTITSAGTLTASGDLAANGNTTIGNATTDRLTVTAQILGASPLVFQGGTENSFTTTLAFTDPTTPSKIITFPDATITVNAAANISGTTLASNVVTSSLTTVGALASGSIASGFGSIATTNTISTSNNISTTGSGTITSAGLLTGSLGAAISGAATSINASSNFDTNINTGSSTGTVTIGNGSSTAIKLGKFATGNGVLFVSDTAGTLTETAASVGPQCLTSASAGAAPAWGSCALGTTGVTSVAGTANQITASPTTGDVILSLPSAITTPGSLTATGDFAANGNTTIGNATSDRLTVTAQILGASPLVFQGATDDAFTTTLAFADPTTPSKTITFPNATITVNAAADISGTTLASNVVTSSLTTVGALASGSIASGFGSIATANTISTSNNISTTGSGTITSASGLTLTTGALSLTATSGALTLSGLSASSISTGVNALTFTSSNFNTTATGINSTPIGATTASTGAFTSLSSTIGTTLASTSGNVAIGNGTGTFTLTSSGGLNVTTAGALSGISTIATSSTINSQTISSTASFTGTLAFATSGTADTSTILCKNSSNQLATCNAGSTVSGSGTSGQIAFFNGTNSIISESSGFGWDTTNKLFTLTSTTATGSAEAIVANSLTTGTALSITSTSALGTANTSDYGINIARSGANAGATHLAYGINASVTNTGTTSTNYGIFSTASGATANYALYTNSGSVFNNLAASEQFHVTTAAAVGNGATVAKIDNTSANQWASTLLSVNTASTDPGNSVSQYGIYNTFSNPTAYTGTATGNYYGMYGSTSKTGADSASFTPTINTYGIYQVARNTGAGNTGTRNTMGVYSMAQADTAGTSTAYGVYASAYGADSNVNYYGADISTTATANYGINLGTLGGGTTANYQISTGLLTSATTTTNAQINLGGITTTNGTTNYGINVGALTGTGTTNFGIAVQALTSVGTSDYGLHVGGLSGASTNNYGLNIGAISTATGLDIGINMGTLGGGTGSSIYGINTGALTSATSTATAYQINLGTTAGISGATFGGVNVGGISGAGTASYGINIAANSSTATTNYGINIATLTSVGTNSYGLAIGGLSGASTTVKYGTFIGNISGTSVSNYGMSLGTLTGGTFGNYQISTGTLTAIASATNTQINLDTITGTAASSNNYGINIGAINSTGTANYGINVSSVIGATTNYGIFSKTGAASSAITSYPLFLQTTAPTTAGQNADNLIGISASAGGLGGTSVAGGTGSGINWTFGTGGAGITSLLNFYPATGGTGGGFSVTGGVGGATTGTGRNLSGTGGSITLTGGAGGAATSGGNVEGIGGSINLVAGNSASLPGSINIGAGTIANTIHIGDGTVSSTNHPIQNLNPALTDSAQGSHLFTGFSFIPKTEGKITQLGMKCDGTNVYTLKLYNISASPAVLLASVSSSANNGSWNYVNITAVDVNPQTTYQVQSDNATRSCNEVASPLGLTFPLTSANVNVKTWYNDISDPAVAAGVEFDGGADITFIATSAETNMASTIWTLSAEGSLRVDASTTPNTTLNGVIDVNATSATSGFSSLNTNTTLSSTTAGTFYGQYNMITNATASISANQSIFGNYNLASRTGTSINPNTNYSVYGVFGSGNITNGSTNTGHTQDAYGGYFLGSGDNNGSSRAVGVYGAASGANQNIGSYYLGIDSTAVANKSYGLWGEVVHTGNAAKIGTAVYGDISSNSTTADTLYGAYLISSATGNAARTANYGAIVYGNTTSTTADAVYGIYGAASSNSAATTGTKTVYGIYGIGTEAAGSGSTAYVYGGIFNATSGNCGSATCTNYGVYAAASGGDTNWGLVVAANSNVQITDLNATSGNVNVCSDTTHLIKISGACTGTDYPEYFPVTSDVQPGDVVKISNTPNPLNDTNAPFLATKTAVPYDASTLGVMSSIHEEDTVGASWSQKKADYYHLLALVGRVQTKVNNENGPIAIGDLLTSSSTPGVAMKADITKGSIIGKALEPYSGSGQGQILVFLENSTRYNLADALQNTDLSAQSFATSSGSFNVDASGNLSSNTLTANQLTITGNVTTAGNVIAGGTILAAGGKFTVDASGNLSSNSLTSNQLNITGDAQVGGNLTADSVSTSKIQSLASTDLTISLGDSAGSNSLKILDSTNHELLTINTKGALSLSAANASLSIPNGYICVNNSGTCNIANPINGTVYADNFSTAQTADLAEHFPSQDNTIGAGDLVAVDPNNSQNVIKSSVAYQNTLLGIISTAPGFTLNTGKGQALSDNTNPKDLALDTTKAVALAGRVPVKVNLENGAIKAGDPITSSSVAGVGMKATQAGRVIGIALESFDLSVPSDPSSVPSNEPSIITVFVNPSWYTGTALAANGSIAQDFTLKSQTEGLALNNTTNIDGTLASAPTNQNKQLTETDIKQIVDKQVDAKIDSLIASGKLQPTSYQSSTATNQISAPVPTTAVLGESTASASINNELLTTNQPESSASAAIASGAQIAAETDATLAKLTELMSTKDLSLDTLNVNGPARLATTQVAGTLSQDGTFVIDYGKQLNVLGNTLFVQNDVFAGNNQGILVDIGAGAITIDKTGNLVTKGTITAQNIETKEITIDTSDVNAQTVGSGSIPIGKTTITIFTTAIKPNAKVLLTPTGPTGGKALYVATKSDFEGFTVALDGTVATNKIEFDWLIVNTKQISANTTSNE